MTRIVVAHRPETIRASDRIVSLIDGEIAGGGTPKVVRRRDCGWRYAESCNGDLNCQPPSVRRKDSGAPISIPRSQSVSGLLDHGPNHRSLR